MSDNRPCPLYYVQDNRQVVGNCLSWHREGGHGYTCDIQARMDAQATEIK